MARIFADFDIATFWEPSEYATKNYVGAPLTGAAIAAVEKKLGFRLPASYIEFMQFQNGGIPRCTNHRTKERSSWSHDHIAITGLYSIGGNKPYSLLGGLGSQFWIEEWGYPPIGVYFADCPSAGHDMVCLDYRACGPTGEPQVVHIDQEWDYKIVFVAMNFKEFILGLEDDSVFDDNARTLTLLQTTVARKHFSVKDSSNLRRSEIDSSDAAREPSPEGSLPLFETPSMVAIPVLEVGVTDFVISLPAMSPGEDSV